MKFISILLLLASTAYAEVMEVWATREGLIGRKTAVGHVIKEDDIFVALPSKLLLNMYVKVTYANKAIVAKVLDVGPWSTRDNYIGENRRPASESGDRKPEYLLKKYGPARNKSGIDLSDGLWDTLGIPRGAGIVKVKLELLDHGVPMKCDHCNYTTNSKKGIRIHLSKKHNIKDGDVEKKICPICSIEIVLPKGNKKNKRKKFCSESCRLSSMKMRNKEPNPELDKKRSIWGLKSWENRNDLEKMNVVKPMISASKQWRKNNPLKAKQISIINAKKAHEATRRINAGLTEMQRKKRYESLAFSHKSLKSKNHRYCIDLLLLNYPNLKIQSNVRSLKELKNIGPKGGNLEVDIAIVGKFKEVYIEWNGKYWHDKPQAQKNDNLKNDKLGDLLLQVVDIGGHSKKRVSHLFLRHIKPFINTHFKDTNFC